MVIVGEMKSKFDEDPSLLPACTEAGEENCDPCRSHYATGFNTFYRSMMDTPFFGEWYSVIGPLFILLCSLLALAFGMYQRTSRALEALALYNAKREGPSEAKASRVEK